MLNNAAIPAHTDVLIIGGGPCGLVMSGLLSSLGISNVLVERRAALPCDPAAHVMRERSVAVLSMMGLGAALDEVSPDLPLDFITWRTTLAGKEIGRLDFRTPPKDLVKGALYPWKNIPQNLLQPVLASHVMAQPQANMFFGVECTGVEDGYDDIVARLVRQETGETHTITATYAVAADGAGSPTRAALGIAMEGDGPLGQFHMIHFAADLRSLTEHRSGPIYWIHHPEAPGAFIVHDAERSAVFMTPVFGTDNEVAGLPALLAKALGAEIKTEILSIRRWTAHAQVAEHYWHGHVLLLGDAAHRFPPTGGLGLNTGIMEAHNLAWKLALVIKGLAAETLLDTYEDECKPAAKANTEDSLHNQQRLGLIGNILGWSKSLVELETRINTLSANERVKLDEAIESQRSHFAFNGTMPGANRFSGASRIGPVIAPYGTFRLYASAETEWTRNALHHLSGMGLAVAFHLLPDVNTPAWGKGAEAVLMRPDGFVEWSAERIDTHTFADLINTLNRFLGTKEPGDLSGIDATLSGTFDGSIAS